MQDSNTAMAPVVVSPTPLSAQHQHLLEVRNGMAPALMTARYRAAGPAGRRVSL
jgi:hypothetical protein